MSELGITPIAISTEISVNRRVTLEDRSAATETHIELEQREDGRWRIAVAKGAMTVTPAELREAADAMEAAEAAA